MANYERAPAVARAAEVQEAGLGGDQRAPRPRHWRAHQFGVRHPRLSLVIASAALAGVIAICGYQLSYGTYLGAAWLIAAAAGMAAAAAVTAAVVMSRRRHRPAGGLLTAWLVLGLVSASAIRYPFPRGSYGRVQAFFNGLHAALLGYEAVICTALVALFAYLLLHHRARAGGQVK